MAGATEKPVCVLHRLLDFGRRSLQTGKQLLNEIDPSAGEPSCRTEPASLTDLI